MTDDNGTVKDRAQLPHIAFFNEDRKVYFMDSETVGELLEALRHHIDHCLEYRDYTEILVRINDSGWQILVGNTDGSGTVQ